MDLLKTTYCSIVYNRGRICGNYNSSMSSNLDEKDVKELVPRERKRNCDFL